jgi:hypothetical protein
MCRKAKNLEDGTWSGLRNLAWIADAAQALLPRRAFFTILEEIVRYKPRILTPLQLAFVGHKRSK